MVTTPLDQVREGSTVLIGGHEVLVSSVRPSPRNRNFWTVFGRDETGEFRSVTNDVRKGTTVEVVS